MCVLVTFQYKDEHFHAMLSKNGFGWFQMFVISHVHIIIKASTGKNAQLNIKWTRSDIAEIQIGKQLFLETTASNYSPTLVFKHF